MTTLTATMSSLHRELCGFCLKNRDRVPDYDWAVAHAVTVLQNHPSGVSRSVLLTELEHRWRTALRRGELAGRLKQALSNKQLATGEVLAGTLGRVDDLYRYKLEQGGASVEMIVHQQLGDWLSYCRHHEIEPLLKRRVHITQARILWGSGGGQHTLLPTTCLCPSIDLSQQSDSNFYSKKILESFQPFYADACSGNVTALVSASSDITKPLFVVASVLDIGPVTSHQDNINCYRIVRMKLRCLDGQQRVDVGSRQIIFIILFNEHVFLADLWKTHDTLVFFRPWAEPNHKQPLFGKRISGANTTSRGAFAHTEVQPADDMLLNALEDKNVVPVHLLVIPNITVCCFLRGAGVGRIDLTDSGSGSSSGDNGDSQQSEALAAAGPIDFFASSALPGGHFTAIARLLGISYGNNRPDADFIYLWMQPENEENERNASLLRVKCPSSWPRQHLHRGQVYLFEGLSRERGAPEEELSCPPHNLLPQWTATAQVKHLALGKFGSGGGRQKNLLTTPSSSVSMTQEHHHPASLTAPSSIPSHVNVSRLAALVYSPSIMNPQPLSSIAAAAVTRCNNSMYLVIAKIASMHQGHQESTFILRLTSEELQGFSIEVEVDSLSINLTQALPNIDPSFSLEAANTPAFAAKWRDKKYVLLLSRIDDVENAASVGACVAVRYRVGCIADSILLLQEEATAEGAAAKRPKL